MKCPKCGRTVAPEEMSKGLNINMCKKCHEELNYQIFLENCKKNNIEPKTLLFRNFKK